MSSSSDKLTTSASCWNYGRVLLDPPTWGEFFRPSSSGCTSPIYNKCTQSATWVWGIRRLTKMKHTLRGWELLLIVDLDILDLDLADANGPLEVNTVKRRTMNSMVVPVPYFTQKNVVGHPRGTHQIQASWLKPSCKLGRGRRGHQLA